MLIGVEFTYNEVKDHDSSTSISVSIRTPGTMSLFDIDLNANALHTVQSSCSSIETPDTQGSSTHGEAPHLDPRKEKPQKVNSAHSCP